MKTDRKRSSGFLDRFGMIMALGCALHCLALTLVFVLYPALWLNRRLWESGLIRQLFYLETGLLAATWLVVIVAFVIGWRRHHRLVPVSLAVAGLALITPAILVTELHFRGWWGSGLAVAGGITLALAHWLNLRAARAGSPR